MNQSKVISNTVMFILLILVTLSVLGEIGRFHYIAGSLLLLKAAGHVIFRWQWVKAVTLKRTRSLSKPLRTRRWVDVSMMFLGVICGVSGFVMWGMGTWLPDQLIVSKTVWLPVHISAGFLLWMLMIKHVVDHRKWFSVNYKRIFMGKSNDTVKQI
jgi:hypothetical protein